MAIYHLSVQVIGRKAGRSAVAAAAYRSASRLCDRRIERDHDFCKKRDVVHSEVLLPDGAPEMWEERERLWNDVEAVELRKDAQLAREVEFAIPREMNARQGIDLARDFVQSEFVDRGMIADLNVHWDIGADGMPRPHAHVMLTMRAVNEDGFGKKVREWNRTEMIECWRQRWAEHVNERLVELDIDARIDHRSLEAQGIDLEPQSQIGAPAQRIEIHGVEAADRADVHREIARNNGDRIIADPSIALDAITHQQSTFTRRDIAMFAHRHSDGIDQFNEVTNAIGSSPDLVELGQDGRGQDRFTTREMIEAERRLHHAAELMAGKELHEVRDRDRAAAMARAAKRGLILSGEQADALTHVTEGRGLGIVVGYAGTGKSAMLGVAREAWEAAGHEVRGVALSGIAAEGLENGSGIASRTIASLEHGWAKGRDLLTARDVLVIDEAGMVGTRQLERVLSHAAERGAKVVLVGDPQQLQSIEAGAAFRSLHERHGGIGIGEVRRQRESWQREATRDLANGRTREALHAYDNHDMVHAARTREQAREDLIDGWDRERQASPNSSRIILTHTNAEVRTLNDAARERMRVAGDLGVDVDLTVDRGARSFARGDRIMFLQNERGLGVKNGTLGIVESIDTRSMSVRTDDGRSIGFDLKDYDRIDHGYAATIHKAQGMTVDCTHVLATPGLDAHGSYVAMSRHRNGMDLHYGSDDFASPDKLIKTLSRDRAKDMATDYEQQLDPAQEYAERRGLLFRARMVEMVREYALETVHDRIGEIIFSADGAVRSGPERDSAGSGVKQGIETVAREAGIDPEDALRHARRLALVRHAHACGEVLDARHLRIEPTIDQRRELGTARRIFDAVRPFGWQDAEAAYNKDNSLAREAGSGRPARAIRALQQETGLRMERDDLARRADRFVTRWQKLGQAVEQRYAAGDYSGHHAARDEMGEMVKSLERDPQLESLLENRKRELGIHFETDRSLGGELALSRGLGRGRGRGLGL